MDNLTTSILTPDFDLSPELVNAGETASADTNHAPVLLDPLAFGFRTLDAGQTVTGLTFDLQASDADGDALQFSITGGADADLFSIDPVTGQIRLEATIRPGAPLDADRDMLYVIEVTVTDGQASDTERVEIDIDAGPANLTPFLPFTVFLVNEGSTGIGPIQAVDPEGDTLTFQLLDGKDADLLTLDPATGTLSFRDAPRFETPSDADADNVYAFNFRVSDGTTDSIHSGEVHVRNVDNVAPVLAEPIVFAVTEGLTDAGTLMAFDVEGDPIRFAVAGGPDADLFTVDSITGELRFIAAPDFELPEDADQDNVYRVDIEASDPFGATTQTVEVRVEEVICLDCPGIVDIIAPVPTEPFQPVRQFLSTASAGRLMDLDVGGGYVEGEISFRLFGEDATLFDVDPTTGEIRLDASLSGTTSFDGDQIYEIIVTAENSLGASAVMELDYVLLVGA